MNKKNRLSTFSMENLLFLHALSSRICHIRWTNKSMNFHGSNTQIFHGDCKVDELTEQFMFSRESVKE